MNTELIEFANRNGLKLHGFFHEPEVSLRGQRKDLIIFPNGGLMGCEGDFRAHVRIARLLVENGFYIFRFSPSGLGLSEGMIDACRREELGVKICTGMFVEDIKIAVEFIQSKMSFDSITLAGICGGAISAFISAAQIKEVNNVILIGMPIVLDSEEGDYVARIPKEQAKFILKTYTNKLFSISAWFRFVSGKSDWQTIKMIINKLLMRRQACIDEDNTEKGFKTNPDFLKAARKIIGNKNVIFIFGDTDWIVWEFENYFINKYFADKKNMPFDFFKITNANHMLTWVEMQETAAKKICTWVNGKTM